MPWKKSGSGYTTPQGGFVKNTAQYERLKASGMSKREAAAIANSNKKKKS